MRILLIDKSSGRFHITGLTKKEAIQYFKVAEAYCSILSDDFRGSAQTLLSFIKGVVDQLPDQNLLEDLDNNLNFVLSISSETSIKIAGLDRFVLETWLNLFKGCEKSSNTTLIELKELLNFMRSKFDETGYTKGVSEIRQRLKEIENLVFINDQIHERELRKNISRV